MQGMDVFLRVITSIPGIDNHDANSVIFLSLDCIPSFLSFSRNIYMSNCPFTAGVLS